jgi:hypothetical protein
LDATNPEFAGGFPPDPTTIFMDAPGVTAIFVFIIKPPAPPPPPMSLPPPPPPATISALTDVTPSGTVQLVVPTVVNLATVAATGGTITATPELSDVYENAPELSDVGAVSEKDASANEYAPDFGPSVNVPNVGANPTVSNELTLLAE